MTQRGNRRQQTFFCEEDYLSYLNLMSQWCKKQNVECIAYCLMPNHLHLVLIPSDEKGLQLAVGEAHRRYTRMINFRKGWRGH
ncbi:MAG: transposase [Desulfobacteraceae bacterium]|nr:transposase [Desulfobacteraceae bacterium]